MSMTSAGGSCGHAGEACDKLYERCAHLFPCLCEPERRSSWGLKAALVLLHVVLIGGLFILDSELIRKTREEPWYTGIYLLLFAVTLFQYFYTSGSSPGYVVDAITAYNGTPEACVNSLTIPRQSSSRNGSTNSSTTQNMLGRNTSRMNSYSWIKIMMDLYPPGSSSRNWTCSYCNIVQPPRSKHCHDCDKCVLQFDHHCVWLGTCIGQGNHCRFWWFIFEESILCIWTCMLYISFLQSKLDTPWWKDVVGVMLLAVLIFCLVFLLLLLLFHRAFIEASLVLVGLELFLSDTPDEDQGSDC